MSPHARARTGSLTTGDDDVVGSLRLVSTANERARTIQRLEKVLQDAGIKLSSVASTTYSKSARAMLEALLSGVSDPEQRAELAKARMRLKIPQLREALQSRFQIEHHGIMVAQLLAHIDTLDAALQNLTERIEFAPARDQSSRAQRRTPTLATGR
jgi:hypothetical protein